MLAIPVPTIPKTRINNIECWVSGKETIDKKSVENKITKAGTNNTTKFPVVMLKGFTSDSNFLIKFTLTA